MANKFNLSRYYELLEKKDSMYEQGNLIFNDPNFLELLSMEAEVDTQLHFNRKNEYYSLIKKYLNTTISPDKFRFQFLDMVKEDDEKATKLLQDFKQLSSFSIDDNLDTFSSLFVQILNNCLQAFEFGPENDGYGLPENDFQTSIEEAYFQLENYFTEKH